MKLQCPDSQRGWSADQKKKEFDAIVISFSVPAAMNLNSEVEQVVLVLENSRYLTVTLIERSSAGRFGPCFDAGFQQIEHEQTCGFPASRLSDKVIYAFAHGRVVLKRSRWNRPSFS